MIAVISFQKLAPKATLSVLVFKIWKYVSQLPGTAQKCFCIQNKAMYISFQKNIVQALLDEYCQNDRAKTQSHFYWDTQYKKRIDLYFHKRGYHWGAFYMRNGKTYLQIKEEWRIN